MQSPLPLEFFQRTARVVARDLIGRRLVRASGNALIKSQIIETEAYEGPHDLACHSSRGRTARTEVMFGPAGCFYIYRIYGLHWMLNVVTGTIGDGAAVLIRGTEHVSGPGRITAALGIDASINGRLADHATGLWFETGASSAARIKIKTSARIGVAYAGPVWSKKKLRYELV